MYSTSILWFGSRVCFFCSLTDKQTNTFPVLQRLGIHFRFLIQICHESLTHGCVWNFFLFQSLAHSFLKGKKHKPFKTLQNALCSVNDYWSSFFMFLSLCVVSLTSLNLFLTLSAHLCLSFSLFLLISLMFSFSASLPHNLLDPCWRATVKGTALLTLVPLLEDPVLCHRILIFPKILTLKSSMPSLVVLVAAASGCSRNSRGQQWGLKGSLSLFLVSLNPLISFCFIIHLGDGPTCKSCHLCAVWTAWWQYLMYVYERLLIWQENSHHAGKGPMTSGGRVIGN